MSCRTAWFKKVWQFFSEGYSSFPNNLAVCFLEMSIKAQKKYQPCHTACLKVRTYRYSAANIFLPLRQAEKCLVWFFANAKHIHVQHVNLSQVKYRGWNLPDGLGFAEKNALSTTVILIPIYSTVSFKKLKFKPIV